MNITPTQALQILLDNAHQNRLPKQGHDELDALARFVAEKLPAEEPAPQEAPELVTQEA